MFEQELDPSIVSPDLCVANNFRKISRTLVQAYEEALKPSGITIAQFSTLGTLNGGGPLSIQQLAEAMEIDRTTLARNLKPLTRSGLVEVRPNPQDRRGKIVQISQAGLLKLQEAAPLWLSAQTHFVQGLGTSELDHLMKTFAHIRKLADSQ
ncbi:MAG: MarR family transcriptional regulator [Chloroflexota bacterium]